MLLTCREDSCHRAALKVTLEGHQGDGVLGARMQVP